MSTQAENAGRGQKSHSPVPARGTSKEPFRAPEIPLPSSAISRPGPAVHVSRVDYESGILYDAQGCPYVELSDSTWIEMATVGEGSVRYWGSGSHSGHINLFPLWEFREGGWFNVVNGKREQKSPRIPWQEDSS
ncbi:MAG: hypothetical protein ACOYIK_03970 [Coriobacteriales bacterium]